jgi:hypothetical protein
MKYALLSYRQEGFCFWEYVEAFLRFGEDPQVPMAPEPGAGGNPMRIPFPAIIQASVPKVKITFILVCLTAQTGAGRVVPKGLCASVVNDETLPSCTQTLVPPIKR